MCVCMHNEMCVHTHISPLSGGYDVLYPQKLGGPRRKVYGMYILGMVGAKEAKEVCAPPPTSRTGYHHVVASSPFGSNLTASIQQTNSERRDLAFHRLFSSSNVCIATVRVILPGRLDSRA